MSGLTLAAIPGFVDLPDSVFTAEDFALGLNISRVLLNAKFGIVRPEVFYGLYQHGDTVPLPTSPVDGYTYERAELLYMWHMNFSGAKSGGVASGNQPQWYFGNVVHQDTGDVESWICYRVSDQNQQTMTNDGVIGVMTIGVRRQNLLIVGGGPLPAWSDTANSAWAEDKPLLASLLTKANHNAKLAGVSNEVFYMGEFVNGGVVPLPVSPVDGYHYGATEVTWSYNWRWTTRGDQFTDPSPYNQTNRFDCSVDSSGNVSTEVWYIDADENESHTNYGRIAVFALCSRKPCTMTAEANVFSDLDPGDFGSGQDPRYDVMEGLADTIRFARVRTEFFVTNQVNGDTVALPVSPVDGYTYARAELTYFCDWVKSWPNTAPRIYEFYCDVNSLTGLVSAAQIRMNYGGDRQWTNDGTVRVITVARRSHVTPAVTDPGLVDQNGSNLGGVPELQNGDFEQWSAQNQAIADYWTVGYNVAGSAYPSHYRPGIDGPSAQAMNVPAMAAYSILSSKMDCKVGDTRYLSFKCVSSAATTNAMYARIHLYNMDLSNHVYFDLISNQPFLGSFTLQEFDLWYEVPRLSATTVNTSRGVVPIFGTYDFVPRYGKLELIVYDPNVDVAVVWDTVRWGLQPNPAQGQVGLRGPLGLAFYPAFTEDLYPDHVVLHMSDQIEFNDGRIIPPVGDVTITGLAASTKYSLYLLWDETRRIVTAIGADGQSGLVGGGSPTWLWSYLYLVANPSIARAIALAWNAPNYVPLSSGPIYLTTQATGGGMGGGSGGGDNGCPRAGMFVKEFDRGLIRVEELNPWGGERLWNGGDEWTETRDVDIAKHDEWAIFDFSNGLKGLVVTSGGIFEDSDGREVRAYEMALGTRIACPTGLTSPTSIRHFVELSKRVRIRCARPHTYMLSPDGGLTWVRYHNAVIGNGGGTL